MQTQHVCHLQQIVCKSMGMLVTEGDGLQYLIPAKLLWQIAMVAILGKVYLRSNLPIKLLWLHTFFVDSGRSLKRQGSKRHPCQRYSNCRRYIHLYLVC